MKISDEDLYQVVVTLIGEVNPTGSHEVDTGERMDNLKRMTALTERLLEDLGYVARCADCQAYSMKMLGKYAKDFLEGIKE